MIYNAYSMAKSPQDGIFFAFFPDFYSIQANAEVPIFQQFFYDALKINVTKYVLYIRQLSEIKLMMLC